MKYRQKGITLIALVVTIIVLIILAGVSISMIVGENGIIAMAKLAKENTELAEIQERQELANVEKYIENTEDSTGLRDETNHPELQTLQLKINSGSDRYIGVRYKVKENEIPIVTEEGEEETYLVDESTVIDWGDGTKWGAKEELAKQKNKVQEKVKLASISSVNSLKVGARQELDTFIYHTYEEGNKEYAITISNTFEYLQLENLQSLLEIEQWGMTGLKGIDLSNCTNLKKIAEPTKHSFDEIAFVDPKSLSRGISTMAVMIEEQESGFDYAFKDCTSLEEIPDNLFANCSQITTFTSTFEGCTSLKNIPENLFKNCPNVIDFGSTFMDSGITSLPQNLFNGCPAALFFNDTFAECENLTGKAIPLWNRRISIEIIEGVFGMDIPEEQEEEILTSLEESRGMYCYFECEGLEDYDTIPENWK